MDKNRHLISKYLGGELDAESTARFEEDLKRDPGLREEMELFVDIDRALADTELIDFRMQLQELHKQLEPEIHSKSRSGMKRVTIIAAAASLALILGFSAVNLFRYNTSQKLLDKYYSPYEITSTNRSAASDADKVIRNAMEKYQNQQYGEAVVLFEKILENNPEQMAAQLYNGISNFEIKEYQKAGKSFTRVIEHNDNLYIEQAKWYLGFCYLKTDEKEKAIKQFREIADSNSYYSDKARKILRKLK